MDQHSVLSKKLPFTFLYRLYKKKAYLKAFHLLSWRVPQNKVFHPKASMTLVRGFSFNGDQWANFEHRHREHRLLAI